MDKSRTALIAFTLVAIIGCGHQITDKDVVGNWKHDPSTPNRSKNPEVEEKMVFTFSEDHSYVLRTPTPAGFKGTWALNDKTLTITPTTLVIENPTALGKKLEMPISQAVQQMQSSGANPQMIQSLQEASVESTFQISDDGKKLGVAGKSGLMKVE